jgi:hypothetical protein
MSLAGLVSELDADIGLVGGLVVGESRVAIWPHQRAAGGPGIRDEVGRELLQLPAEVRYEVQRGIPHNTLVAILVGIPPGLLVVGFQLAEEGEQCGGEMLGGQDRSFGRTYRRYVPFETELKGFVVRI